ncbi:MAG: T9SS type A sorting domain-containing protein [Dysgonamonadaceae bacterium]|nr:T9SS type A sorting domain-containing protein [Dysgonamonadaceae bacterium]
MSVQNNGLKIGELSAGDVFSVYNVQGRLIYKGTATASENSVNPPSRGVYIVATDKERAKVF